MTDHSGGRVRRPTNRIDPPRFVQPGYLPETPSTLRTDCRHVFSDWGRTSGIAPPTFLRRPGSRLFRFSRDRRPRGSLLPFGRGMLPEGSTPIRSATDRRWLSPRSSTRNPISDSCESPSLVGRVTGLPRCIAETAWVRSCLSADGSTSAPGEFGAPGLGHLPFGPSLSASLACPS